MITSSYQFVGWSEAFLVAANSPRRGIEHFYNEHIGLITVVGLVVTTVGALFTAAAFFRRVTKEAARRAGGAPWRWVRGLLLNDVEQRASVTDGLRQAIRIDLNLTYTPIAVPVELRAVEERGLAHSECSTEDTIAQIFKRTGGRLLILGDPGTGKSNLLHELARELVREARNDLDHPIPILLNLARWALGEHTRTLEEWIRDDLHELYGLTTNDADTLIGSDAIIPMLDGLDEVDDTRRLWCVEAINNYQNDRSVRFAVCCRWQEYAQLIEVERDNPGTTSQIRVRSAIRVERLSHNDIERELSRPGLERVRDILQNDQVLRSFVDTPLWLHVLFLGSLANPLSFGAANPRDRLYDNYVSHLLARRPDGIHQKQTKESNLLRWLGWLATEMHSRHQTQFVLEDLDWSWISQRSHLKPFAKSRAYPQVQYPPVMKKKRIRIVQRLMFGVGVGTIGTLAGGFLFGGLVGVLALLRVEGRIEAAEHLEFKWRRAISRWHFGFAYGSIFATAFAWLHGPVAGAYLWLFAAVFEMFQGGFQARSGDGGVAPNRATMRSLRYALGFTLAGGILALTAIACAQWAVSNHVLNAAARAAITEGARWIAFAAFVLGGEKGGWFVIRHYAVRLLLWRHKVVPASYVRFLNESVERLFLIRRGGTYEFIHLTFRDYMAAYHSAQDVDPQRPKHDPKPKRAYYPARAHMILARLAVYETDRSRANHEPCVI